MSTKNKIRELLDLRKQYDSQLKEFGQEALGEDFAALFEKFPAITAIKWTQYTPYFNDGDACYFRVGEAHVRIGGAALTSYVGKYPADDYYGDDDVDEEGGAWFYRWGAKPTPEVQEAVEAAVALVESYPDDVLEQVFGDHVAVTALPGGKFKVEDCDHD